MTSLVLAPYSNSRAVELGNRMWLKKILPVGSINYKGRELKFNREYLGGIVQAFRDRAYDQVPLQLADSQNAHTNDPERTRGEVTGMELRDDGLYVLAQVTPEGEEVLSRNPKLGVSARIVEGYDRADGKYFPAAIQHVLATLDPRIPGLGSWEAIEAANTADQVIDLSGASFEKPPKPPKKHKAAPPDPVAAADPAGDGADPEGAGVADLRNLTAQQQERLSALLDLPDETFTALAAGGTVLTPDELAALTDGAQADSDDDLAAAIDGMSDEELAAMEAEFNAEQGQGFTPGYMPEGQPAGAAALANDLDVNFLINLANARQEETLRELAVVTARLREEDFQAERRRLADLGVPGFITDLAKPLLEGAGHAVELANGKTVDAGGLMRRVLTEYAAQVRLLDLGTEMGSPHDEPAGISQEQAGQATRATADRFLSETGLR